MSEDIGIDLGTASVIACVKGKGIVLREPSVVAIDKNTNDVIAIGNGYDDVCMFDVAGTSIAVGNANFKLKEVATYIADSVENDGAVKMLEKLLLEDS